MWHQFASYQDWGKARREQWGNGRNAEMVASVPYLIDSDSAASRGRSHGRADRLLCLAATPTFAIMALLTGIHGDSMAAMLCPATGNGLPLSGMCLMYVLMSAFHLRPWLKLISRRISAADR